MSDASPQLPSPPVNLIRKHADFGVCVLLVMAVLVVFGQTLWHGYVNYDDDKYVYDNPHVLNGLTLRGIGWAFTYGEIGHWHPLTWISHMLDAQLFGAGPAGPHLTNVILHAASVVLLFLLLLRMTGARWRSAVVAAVFAIHPLHVESVAWVSERKDVLSGLFFMLTLGAYVRYSCGPFSPGRYTAVVIFFACGLLSKSMLVTLPFVLLLLDYWPLQRASNAQAPGNSPPPPDIRHSTWPRLLLEKLPFFLLSAVSCLVTSLVPEQIAAIDRLPLSFRMEDALVSYVAYLGQMIYPAGLAVPYPLHALPPWEVAGALSLLATISIVVFRFRKSHPYLMVGWLWYLGMLVPVSGIVQIAYYARADRYTYLPQIGLYLVIVWAVKDLTASWRHQRQLLRVAACCVIAVLMLCAWKQATYWRNGESLWRHALACTSGNFTAENNLGYTLAAQGRTAEAVGHYEKALEINPDYAEADINLGRVFLNEGRLDEAAEYFQRAIKVKPASAEAQNDLGILRAGQGLTADAFQHYQKAVELNPDFAEAYNNLAILLASQGRFAESEKNYQKTLELKPDYADAQNNFGILLARQGRLTEAMEHFKKALQIRGGSAEAENDLGLLLVSLNQAGEAVPHYQKAIELKPDCAEAHLNLGAALAKLGDIQGAIGHWEQTLKINPDNATAHDYLGVALADQGRLAEAMEHFQKSIVLANVQNNPTLVSAIRIQMSCYQTNSVPKP